MIGSPHTMRNYTKESQHSLGRLRTTALDFPSVLPTAKERPKSSWPVALKLRGIVDLH